MSEVDTDRGRPSSPVEAAARWLDERFHLAEPTRKLLRKPFPGHWSFLIGEIALFALVVLFLTGTFLALFYRPDTRLVTYTGPYEPLQGEMISLAYESVLRLSFEVRAGLLMRQIHHHAANVFMAAIIVHMFRVFFTGAFRRPREMMWVTGVALVVVSIGAGFTGYSLPDDLLSGSGLQIAYSVLLSVPFVGPFLAWVSLGGDIPNPDLMGRLHILHVMILPAILVVLVSIHLAILFRVRHAQHPGGPRTERNVVGKPLFPTQTMISTAAFFGTVAVLALLGGLYEINPVWVYGPFEPWRVVAPLQPDWYVGWLEGLLRLWPAWDFMIFGIVIPQPFIPGVIIPGVIFTLGALYPWIEQRWITKDAAEHNLLSQMRDVPLRAAIGTGGIFFLLVMLVAGSNDVLAADLFVPVETVTNILRAAILLGPFLIGFATYRWCVHLRERDAAEATTARERR